MKLRQARPATLILALICFCLPWLDIRCNSPDHGLIVTTQSGLQMTYGGTTTIVNGKAPSDAERRKYSQSAGEREQPVPLIIFYAGCLLIALLASFFVTNKAWRRMIATLASGCAAVALVVQLALGFPLVEGIPRGEGGWNYTIWFWMALVCTLAAPLSSVWERLDSKSATAPASPP